jgi:rubrerythrin
MNEEQLHELIYQALETEKGGMEIYITALKCVKHGELKQEWERYLEETREHERIVRRLCQAFDLDPGRETPGRKVVRHIGKSLVQAMELALASATPEAAERVAAECVVLAETKDHLNWELLAEAVKKLKGTRKQALEEAQEQVEEQEDEHLYHSTGWTRELWIDSMGLPAVLPPPEEEKDVKTAIGAARARQSREEML